MTDYMIIPKSFCEFILSLPEKEGLLFFEAIGAYMKTGYPWLRTDVDNGLSLCPNCHREVHCK